MSGCGQIDIPLVEFNPDRFEFGVIVECVHGFVAPVAALFKAAERHGDVAAKIVIDAHRPDPHGRRNFVRCIEVFGLPRSQAARPE